MCVFSVAQSCPTLCNPFGCSPPVSSVHGISQAKILDHVTISYSSCHFLFPDPGIKTTSPVSPALAGRFFATVVVQSLSHIQLFATPWTVSLQAPQSFTISWSLLKIMPIESMMLFNYFIFYHPLLLLPSIFPHLKVFSNDLALCIRWQNYWSFSISPSNEYSGLPSGPNR